MLVESDMVNVADVVIPTREAANVVVCSRNRIVMVFRRGLMHARLDVDKGTVGDFETLRTGKLSHCWAAFVHSRSSHLLLTDACSSIIWSCNLEGSYPDHVLKYTKAGKVSRRLPAINQLWIASSDTLVATSSMTSVILWTCTYEDTTGAPKLVPLRQADIGACLPPSVYRTHFGVVDGTAVLMLGSKPSRTSCAVKWHVITLGEKDASTGSTGAANSFPPLPEEVMKDHLQPLETFDPYSLSQVAVALNPVTGAAWVVTKEGPPCRVQDVAFMRPQDVMYIPGSDMLLKVVPSHVYGDFENHVLLQRGKDATLKRAMSCDRVAWMCTVVRGVKRRQNTCSVGRGQKKQAL
jgi:hypothetical protein